MEPSGGVIHFSCSLPLEHVELPAEVGDTATAPEQISDTEARMYRFDGERWRDTGAWSEAAAQNCILTSAEVVLVLRPGKMDEGTARMVENARHGR